MDLDTNEAILATQAALAQASELAVQYSFSIVGALLLLCIGWWLAALLRRWTHAGLMRVRGFDETLARVERAVDGNDMFKVATASASRAAAITSALLARPR